MKVHVLAVVLFTVMVLTDARYATKRNEIRRRFPVSVSRSHSEDGYYQSPSRRVSQWSNRRPDSWSWSERRFQRLKRTANLHDDADDDSVGDSFDRPVKIRIRISRRRGKVPVRDYLHLLNSDDDDDDNGEDAGDMLEQPLRMGKNLKSNRRPELLKKSRPELNADRFPLTRKGQLVAPGRFQIKAERKPPMRKKQKNGKKNKNKNKKKQKKSATRTESDIGRELSALAEWFLRDDAAFDKILQETMSSYRRGRQLRHRRRAGLVGRRQRISLTYRD